MGLGDFFSRLTSTTKNVDERGYKKEKTIKMDVIPTPKQKFICEKPAIELIELKKGKGLFPVGVKKMWNVPTKAQQFKQAQKIPWITKIDKKLSYCTLNLDKIGKFKVTIEKQPYVERTDSLHKWYNPYIKERTYQLCLGHEQNMYIGCYSNGSFLECVKIIKEVLISPDDSEAFRGWDECGFKDIPSKRNHFTPRSVNSLLERVRLDREHIPFETSELIPESYSPMFSYDDEEDDDDDYE